MKVNKYVFSLETAAIQLREFCYKYPKLFKKQEQIGRTTFGFPMEYYTLGTGSKDVILIGATHGCELITVTFLLNFINAMLVENKKHQAYFDQYTFHIIPIVNPEGYSISSCNVLNNIQRMSLKAFEKFSNQYLLLYNQDDFNAEKGIKGPKLYQTLMNTSCSYIPYLNLRKQVNKILENCCLAPSVLPIWSSNGMGVDINANSIDHFEENKRLRDEQKCAKGRYSDIPIDRPSPLGFPGCTRFDKCCPENAYLYHFINKIYDKGNLVLFLSYHSTGGLIFGYPDEQTTSKEQYKLILDGMQYYRYLTNYKIMNEEIKYGVMDYYRAALLGTVTLTIELSPLNANPIGPFADLKGVHLDFVKNINAILYTLDEIQKNKHAS